MKLGTEHVKKMYFLIPGCVDVGAMKSAFFLSIFPTFMPDFGEIWRRRCSANAAEYI
jgi:hypothetical protein